MSTTRLTLLATRLENFSEWTGRSVAWLTLAMVLVTFAIVIFRYVFSMGWIWLQESVSYLHAFVFMLGGGLHLQARRPRASGYLLPPL